MRRHETDWVSVVAGLVFVGIALGYFAVAFADVTISAGWVLPVVLIVLGLAGLAGSLRRARR